MQFVLGAFFALWVVLICMILLQEETYNDEDDLL
jgi:preprotein translocase subunit SecG